MPKNEHILVAVAFLLSLAGCSSRPPVSATSSIPEIILRDAPLIQFRGANSSTADKAGECDCNSPAHWDGDTLYVFNSAGHPWRSAGSDVFHLGTNYLRCEYDNKVSCGRWIECT